MKKFIVGVTVLLLLCSTAVYAADPPQIFGAGVCSFDKMSKNQNYYDCFVDSFLYYMVSINERDRSPYHWNYIAGKDPNFPSSGPMNFFRNIIAPFIALGVVLYGFMTNINIFGRRNNWINIVMAILMILSTFPTGLFEKIVLNNVLRYGSRWTFALWTVLFVIGTWSIFRINVHRITGEAAQEEAKWAGIRNLGKEIRDLESRRSEALKTMSDPSCDAAKAGHLKEVVAKLDAEIDKLKGQSKDLKDT